MQMSKNQVVKYEIRFRQIYSPDRKKYYCTYLLYVLVYILLQVKLYNHTLLTKWKEMIGR